MPLRKVAVGCLATIGALTLLATLLLAALVLSVAMGEGPDLIVEDAAGPTPVPTPEPTPEPTPAIVHVSQDVELLRVYLEDQEAYSQTPNTQQPPMEAYELLPEPVPFHPKVRKAYADRKASKAK